MSFGRGARAWLAGALVAAGLVAFQSAAPAVAAASTVPGTFVSTTPTRLLDTRIQLGGSVLGPGGRLSLSVLGVGQIPTDGVSAVVLNVTVVTPTHSGYLTVWPEGGTLPTVSNLNFAQGQTVANLVVTQVGANGRVDLFNLAGQTQVTADISGYYVSGAPNIPGAFVSTFPTRVLDTRVNKKGDGSPVGPVGPGHTLRFQATGAGPIPSTGVSAVVLNLTATASTASGSVTAFADGTSRPNASNLNFGKGQTVPNLVVVPVGTNGMVDLFNSAGSTQLIADVAGYFISGTPATPATAGTFRSTTPTRLLDTRIGVGGSPIARGGTLSLQVAGASVGPSARVPALGVAAVVLNVTVTQPASGGFVEAWADGTERPVVSNLNFGKDQTVANLVVAPVGADGKVNFYSSATSTQLIADIQGYFNADTTPPGPVTGANLVTNSATSVTLAWANPTDDDFAGVLIRRVVGPAPVAPSPTDGVGVGSTVGATTAFTDTSASPSTSYTYELFAFDSAHNYAPAATVTVVTSARDTTPPGPVTNLSVTPIANTVTLSWTNPTDSDFAGVVIRRAAGTTPPTSATAGDAVTTTTGATATTFIDRDPSLAYSAPYSYALFAEDTSGNAAAAATATVSTLGRDATPPGPVTNLSATVLNNTVSLSWTNPTDVDFAGVVICRSAAGAGASGRCGAGYTSIATLALPAAEYTDVGPADVGLKAATPYTYQVFSFDSSGNYAGAATGTWTTAAASAVTGPGPVVATTSSNVTADALPTAQIDGVAWSQVIVGNTVYVGGSFANARPAGAPVGTQQTPRANMLAYNLTTGVLLASFAPVFNGQVRALAVSPDQKRLYATGDFTTVNGVTHNRIAAFNTATNTLDASFTASLDATGRALVATNAAVYVGGSFSTANNVVRTRLAQIMAGGVHVTAWAPTADDMVTAMVLTPDQSKLVIGGAFTYLNAGRMRGIGAVSSSTGSSVSWVTSTQSMPVYAFGVGSAITSLSTDGTAIYGTAYNYRGSGNIEGAFSVRPGNGAVNWTEDCHGDTYSAFPMNGTVYTVSHAHYCANIGGWPEFNPRVEHHTVAFTTQPTGVLTADTTGYPSHAGYPSPSLVDWFPDLVTGSYTGQQQAAWTVTGNAQYIVEGGEFPTVNGVGQQGLVRFAVPGVAPSQSGPMITGGHFVPTLTSPNHTTIALTFPSNWDRDDKTLYYTIVRNGNVANPVATFAADSEWWNLPTLTFTDTGLTPGVTYRYRIFVSDASGNTVAGDTAYMPGPL